jgi:hypothetical protein
MELIDLLRYVQIFSRQGFIPIINCNIVKIFYKYYCTFGYSDDFKDIITNFIISVQSLIDNPTSISIVTVKISQVKDDLRTIYDQLINNKIITITNLKYIKRFFILEKDYIVNTILYNILIIINHLKNLNLDILYHDIFSFIDIFTYFLKNYAQYNDKDEFTNKLQQLIKYLSIIHYNMDDVIKEIIENIIFFSTLYLHLNDSKLSITYYSILNLLQALLSDNKIIYCALCIASLYHKLLNYKEYDECINTYKKKTNCCNICYATDCECTRQIHDIIITSKDNIVDILKDDNKILSLTTTTNIVNTSEVKKCFKSNIFFIDETKMDMAINRIKTLTIIRDNIVLTAPAPVRGGSDQNYDHIILWLLSNHTRLSIALNTYIYKDRILSIPESDLKKKLLDARDIKRFGKADVGKIMEAIKKLKSDTSTATSTPPPPPPPPPPSTTQPLAQVPVSLDPSAKIDLIVGSSDHLLAITYYLYTSYKSFRKLEDSISDDHRKLIQMSLSRLLKIQKAIYLSRIIDPEDIALLVFLLSSIYLNYNIAYLTQYLENLYNSPTDIFNIIASIIFILLKYGMSYPRGIDDYNLLSLYLKTKLKDDIYTISRYHQSKQDKLYYRLSESSMTYKIDKLSSDSILVPKFEFHHLDKRQIVHIFSSLLECSIITSDNLNKDSLLSIVVPESSFTELYNCSNIDVDSIKNAVSSLVNNAITNGTDPNNAFITNLSTFIRDDDGIIILLTCITIILLHSIEFDSGVGFAYIIFILIKIKKLYSYSKTDFEACKKFLTDNIGLLSNLAHNITTAQPKLDMKLITRSIDKEVSIADLRDLTCFNIAHTIVTSENVTKTIVASDSSGTIIKKIPSTKFNSYNITADVYNYDKPFKIDNETVIIGIISSAEIDTIDDQLIPYQGEVILSNILLTTIHTYTTDISLTTATRSITSLNSLQYDKYLSNAEKIQLRALLKPNSNIEVKVDYRIRSGTQYTLSVNEDSSNKYIVFSLTKDSSLLLDDRLGVYYGNISLYAIIRENRTRQEYQIIIISNKSIYLYVTKKSTIGSYAGIRKYKYDQLFDHQRLDTYFTDPFNIEYEIPIETKFHPNDYLLDLMDPNLADSIVDLINKYLYHICRCFFYRFRHNLFHLEYKYEY